MESWENQLQQQQQQQASSRNKQQRSEHKHPVCEYKHEQMHDAVAVYRPAKKSRGSTPV